MKLRELKEILDYCASTCNYAFYKLDYLNDFSKLGYNSDLEERRLGKRGNKIN